MVPVTVGGHPRGGLLALLWAGRHPDRSRAVVNFNGGWRAASCASAEAVNRELFRRHAAPAPPSLWLYGTHDSYYSIAHSRANFAASEAAGGRGAFHKFQPPPGRLHGHFIIYFIYFPDLWGTTMERYLSGRGLPARVP